MERTGLISAIDDNEMLGEHINELMSNEKLWNKYSNLSLQRSLAFFSSNNKKNNLMIIYLHYGKNKGNNLCWILWNRF